MLLSLECRADEQVLVHFDAMLTGCPFIFSSACFSRPTTVLRAGGIISAHFYEDINSTKGVIPYFASDKLPIDSTLSFRLAGAHKYRFFLGNTPPVSWHGMIISDIVLFKQATVL